MILDMPRTRPPHLHRETTRHGRAVWYVRVDKGPRIRIRALYGTPEFKEEYDAAVEGRPINKQGPANGTLLPKPGTVTEAGGADIEKPDKRREMYKAEPMPEGVPASQRKYLTEPTHPGTTTPSTSTPTAGTSPTSTDARREMYNRKKRYRDGDAGLERTGP